MQQLTHSSKQIAIAHIVMAAALWLLVSCFRPAPPLEEGDDAASTLVVKIEPDGSITMQGHPVVQQRKLSSAKPVNKTTGVPSTTNEAISSSPNTITKTVQETPVSQATPTTIAPPLQLASNGYRVFVIRADGTLWTFGDACYWWSMPDPVVCFYKEPSLFDSDNQWMKVSTNVISAAIKKNGSLWTWGTNAYGALGVGTSDTSVYRFSPAQIGDELTWSSVSVGSTHVLALKSDGSMWAWGENSNGQVGDGSVSNATAPVQIAGGKKWKKIHASQFISFAIADDNTLWSWGTQDSSGTYFSTPKQVGADSDWFEISSSGLSHLALKYNQTLWSWGENGFGQLGDGTKNSSAAPRQIGLDMDWNVISSARNDCCMPYISATSFAIKADGSLWFWGFDATNSHGDKLVPTRIEPQTLWSNIASINQGAIAVSKSGFTFSWGQNERYLGRITLKTVPSKIGNTSDWKSLSTKEGSVIANKNNGSLWGWGSNNGRLGDGTTQNRPLPLQINTSTKWRDVSLGMFHAHAIQDDGSLWSWGQKCSGRLGLGGDGSDCSNQLTPVRVGSENNWKKVSADLDSLAIKTDGTLWAWGHGGNGQIGIGSQQTITVPTKVGNDTDWKDILPGYASSKAIKTDGTLWAWGAHCGNWQFSFVPYMIGQSAATFGSSSKYEFEPILNTVGSIINPCTNSSLFDSNSVWKSVSVGGSSISNGPLFALAIKADGTLWSYGDNSQGQLGDGTTVNRSAPVQISTETNWSIVAAGQWAGYAIKTDGSLWSWGSNSMGQLGIPEFNALIPTIVEFK